MSAWHMRGNSCAAQSGHSQGLWLQGFSPVEERLCVDTAQTLFIRRFAHTVFCGHMTVCFCAYPQQHECSHG